MIKKTSMGITRYPLGKKKTLSPPPTTQKKFHSDNKRKVKLSQLFEET